jgi:hypothetical protein
MAHGARPDRCASLGPQVVRLPLYQRSARAHWSRVRILQGPPDRLLVRAGRDGGGPQ